MTLLNKIKHNIPSIGKNKNEFFYNSIVLSSAIIFIAGILCAFCICMIIGNCIKTRTAELKMIEAESIVNIKPHNNISINKDYSLLISEDPFKTKKIETAGITPDIQSINLVGTLSSFGAYLNDGSDSTLILKGQDFAGFTLVSIRAAEVTVSKNGVESILFMPFTTGGGKSAYANTKPSNKTDLWKKVKPATNSLPGVKAAAPGTTGTVSRELVDKLLLNPYEEMAKIRMIPSENGMRIAKIANDSVLASVGVQTEDIIKAVNGVNITNLGDATNAINSMMTGTKFDVTVERNGKPVALNYEVR